MHAPHLMQVVAEFGYIGSRAAAALRAAAATQPGAARTSLRPARRRQPASRYRNSSCPPHFGITEQCWARGEPYPTDLPRSITNRPAPSPVDRLWLRHTTSFSSPVQLRVSVAGLGQSGVGSHPVRHWRSPGSFPAANDLPKAYHAGRALQRAPTASLRDGHSPTLFRTPPAWSGQAQIDHHREGTSP